MKRPPADFHQSHTADGVARARLKHQTLLQDFLELQREFVSKKRKLQIINQKKDTLLAELRFLRRRRGHLLKLQSQQLAQLQNTDIDGKKFEREKSCGTYEVEYDSLYSVLASNPNLSDGGRMEVEEQQQVRNKFITGNKKRKSYLADGKGVGNKRIPFQGSVTLKG